MGDQVDCIGDKIHGNGDTIRRCLGNEIKHVGEDRGR